MYQKWAEPSGGVAGFQEGFVVREMNRTWGMYDVVCYIRLKIFCFNSTSRV